MTADAKRNGRRFFSHTAWPTRYNTPRSMVAAAMRLPNPKNNKGKRAAHAWQREAFGYYEQIGEVKYAFDMVASLVSRVRLFAAVVDDPDMVPVEGSAFLEQLADQGLSPDETGDVIGAAQEVVSDLMLHSLGLGSGLLRDISTCIQVVGESYLVSHRGRWMAVSPESLEARGQRWRLRLDRTERGGDIELDEDAFVARIWKPSARYANEPTSSMVGVLDSCEALVILDQAIRSMTRTRLGAGVLFIPEGLTATTGNVEEVLVEAVTQPIQDETAATSVVPLILTGPVELGKELKRIDLARPVDQEMIEMADRLLNRILTGIDVPKDIITGLAEVRYANALIITDDLFRTAIEPLVLLICDALTQAVLRPAMRKSFVDRGEHPPQLIDHVVVWFDPSDAVTRPDKSQAANEGFDRRILSAEAWRSSRGFNELDAPSAEEQRERLTLERAMIPPDMAAVMIEDLDPQFFAAARSAGQESAGGFEDLEALLGPPEELPAEPGEQGGPPGGQGPLPGNQPVPSTGQQQGTTGGTVEQGGFMPPRERVP